MEKKLKKFGEFVNGINEAKLNVTPGDLQEYSWNKRTSTFVIGGNDYKIGMQIKNLNMAKKNIGKGSIYGVVYNGDEDFTIEELSLHPWGDLITSSKESFPFDGKNFTAGDEVIFVYQLDKI